MLPQHFAETMRDITTEEDELLVSFDASSLFTNLPVAEVVQVIQAKLREDDSLAKRTPDRVTESLDMCLYFSYGGEFYEVMPWAPDPFSGSKLIHGMCFELSSQNPVGSGCGTGMWMTHAASLGKVT